MWSVGCAVLVAIYFLPTFIAMGVHNVNALAIFLTNLFLGWTFVGWVISLIWAVMK
jgi:hypothetical protein